MAYQDGLHVRGTRQPLSWGTRDVAVTGYVVENQNDDESTEETVIEDEDANPCTQITGYGLKADVSIDVIPETTVTSPPKAGDIFTYGSKKMTILKISKKRVNKDVQKWSISGNRFDKIDLASS